MSAIRFTHVDHCSVIVTDVEKARAFYTGILGLKEIAKPRTFDFVVLWYELSDGQTVHLLHRPEPDQRSPRHFALRVPSAVEARNHFRRLGVPIEETVPIPHCDRFFVYDPDGNRIEIIQWLQPYNPRESGAARLD